MQQQQQQRYSNLSVSTWQASKESLQDANRQPAYVMASHACPLAQRDYHSGMFENPVGVKSRHSRGISSDLIV